MENKTIFLIGIGGIGMSGLAQILSLKNKVLGSDIKNSFVIKNLRRKEIQILIGHKEKNLPDNTDLVIISAAIPKDNPEFQKAKRLNIPIKTRSQVLGNLMQKKYGIAVAGTHGKSTTTALLTSIFQNAGLNPTSLIGAEVSSLKGNVYLGKGDFFIAETCEYKNAFLDLHPKAAIVTNVEMDHIDFFKNFNDVLNSFSCFIQKIPKNGPLVINKNQKYLPRLLKKAQCSVITFGTRQDSDFKIQNINLSKKKTIFEIQHNNQISSITLELPGIHNVFNTTACYALATFFKINPAIIKQSIREFKGAKRRFEIKGIEQKITVIDDYAHHPSEIIATLKAAKQFFPGKIIWVVFQPHQYSRTKAFLREFALALSEASKIILTDIYAARDKRKDIQNVNILDLLALLRDNNKKSFYAPKEKVVELLSQNLKPEDIVFTIGAGDVWEIGEELMKRLKLKTKN